MRPLTYYPACDKCHSHQNYKQGEIRGGISVSMPFKDTKILLSKNRTLMIGIAIGTSLLLAYVLYFFVWKLMNRLTSQNSMLTKLNDSKNKFIGMAVHDLRSPITIFKGYTDFLMCEIIGKVSPQQKDVLNKMKISSETMLELINNILDINSIESGNVELKKEEVEITKYLNEIYEENSMLARSKSIKLTLECEPQITKVILDRNRINQVINNLVTNAIKFSYPESEITIRSKRLKDEVAISVSDQGQGIPKEEIPDLFVDFAKSSVKPTAGEKSTGLGLTIVKRIVEVHNGRLWVESQLNKGSDFYFTLPLKIRA